MTEPTITMTLLVRDEADIIADTLRFHHARGVDRFIVMDNLSTDRTPQILAELAREMPLVILRQEEDTYAQGEWVTQMARQAAREGADWVINGDADEFWLPAEGGLKTYLAGLPADVGMVDVRRHNAVLVRGAAGPLAAGSDPRGTTLFERESLSTLGRPLPAKCLHRASALVEVRQGNHGVAGVAGRRIAAGGDLVILHFPYRALPQYRRKVTLGGAAYERNRDPALPAQAGATWRDHYRQIDSGAVEAFWTGLSLTRQAATIGLLSEALFREERLSDFLTGASARQDALVAAHERLCADSAALVRTFSQEMAGYIARVAPEHRASRPMYYNLEYCVSGANRQLQTLGALPLSGGAAVLAGNFAALRDACSLFPRNEHLRRFLAQLLELARPGDVARLRADCAGRRVVLHGTCQPLMARAEASAASFAALPDLRHILLVGQGMQDEDRTPLDFSYEGGVLWVPTPDSYESLHRKLFYAFMLLDLVADPALVVKVDDNIRLQQAPVFGRLLDGLAEAGVDYAGRVVGRAAHPQQWHGWHIGKCADPLIEARGYQYPLPALYAAGGYGYVLGRRGLAACSYMYLAMKAFFAMQSVGLEDACVGHAAQAGGLELREVSRAGHLLALPGLITTEAEG